MKDTPNVGSIRTSRNPFRRFIRNNTKQNQQQQQQQQQQSHETLFSLDESEMAIYNNSKELNITSSIHSVIKLQDSSSSLISRGKFEIYTINSSLNYFKCGSLIHPILQNCKFIKININTFIIPLKNPIRYWKLSLNTESLSTIDKFQSIIDSIAILEINLIDNYTVQSPFNSFAEIELHHPTPVRPNSSSNTSNNSSILQKYTTSPITSLFNDKEINSDIDPDLDDDLNLVGLSIDSNSEIDIDIDLNSELNVEINFDQEIDPDLDADLTLHDMSKVLIDSDDDDSISELFLINNNNNDNFNNNNKNNENTLTNRYSLSFKSYDLKRPISMNVLDRYKSDLSLMIKNKE